MHHQPAIHQCAGQVALRGTEVGGRALRDASEHPELTMGQSKMLSEVGGDQVAGAAQLAEFLSEGEDIIVGTARRDMGSSLRCGVAHFSPALPGKLGTSLNEREPFDGTEARLPGATHTCQRPLAPVSLTGPRHLEGTLACPGAVAWTATHPRAPCPGPRAEHPSPAASVAIAKEAEVVDGQVAHALPDR